MFLVVEYMVVLAGGDWEWFLKGPNHFNKIYSIFYQLNSDQGGEIFQRLNILLKWLGPFKHRPSWTIFNLFSVRIFWWHLVHSEYPLWVSWHLPFTQASDWNVLPHLWYIIFVTMCQMMLQVRDCYRTTNKGGREGGYSKCSLDHDHLPWGREKSNNDHSITLLNLVWKRKYSQSVFIGTYFGEQY